MHGHADDRFFTLTPLYLRRCRIAPNCKLRRALLAKKQPFFVAELDGAANRVMMRASRQIRAWAIYIPPIDPAAGICPLLRSR